MIKQDKQSIIEYPGMYALWNIIEQNACDFFIQYLVDIFEYIRCSITQYSGDLHKKLIEMSV